MSAPRPFLPDALHGIAPWIAATAALLMAVVILSQFIDTLHLSIQRGQELRSSQYEPSTRDLNVVAHMADSGDRSPAGSR